MTSTTTAEKATSGTAARLASPLTAARAGNCRPKAASSTPRAARPATKATTQRVARPIPENGGGASSGGRWATAPTRPSAPGAPSSGSVAKAPAGARQRPSQRGQATAAPAFASGAWRALPQRGQRKRIMDVAPFQGRDGLGGARRGRDRYGPSRAALPANGGYARGRGRPSRLGRATGRAG